MASTQAPSGSSGDARHTRPTRRPREGHIAGYTAPSLIAVAAEIFNERGYDATSMEDLAAAAGISKSSFYHHVRGKEALLRGALERAVDGLFGVLAEAPAQRGSPLSRLRHIVRRQVEVLAGELPYVTLLLRLRGNTVTNRPPRAAMWARFSLLASLQSATYRKSRLPVNWQTRSQVSTWVLSSVTFPLDVVKNTGTPPSSLMVSV